MLLPWRGHPELVFHVLAHVKATAALPASVYDADYVRFAAERLGPASERPLGEDAAILGRMVTRHEDLARLQLYAALFDEPDDDPRGDLDPARARRPALWPALAQLGPAVEILRCAVALEKPCWETLPPVRADGIEAAVDGLRQVAPDLARHDLLVVRALRRRGRLVGHEIWIGEARHGVDEVDVAWQAAHEATVAEIADDHPDLGERAVEARALRILEDRARAAGLAEAHARWRAHQGASAAS